MIATPQAAENQTVLNTFAYGAKHFLVSGDSDVRLVNVGADNLLENPPMLVTTGGSVTAVNMMRYNGYSFQNGGADLALYNRLTIGLKYERPFGTKSTRLDRKAVSAKWQWMSSFGVRPASRFA